MSIKTQGRYGVVPARVHQVVQCVDVLYGWFVNSVFRAAARSFPEVTLILASLERKLKNYIILEERSSPPSRTAPGPHARSQPKPELASAGLPALRERAAGLPVPLPPPLPVLTLIVRS